MARLFGTDGVRGIANSFDLSPELAYRLGRAGAYLLVAQAFGQDTRPRVVVGKDPRRSGDMLEAALIAGVLSAGADVVRVGVVTTPAVAFLVRNLGAQAGVMISASHNPAEYNGIKFFSSEGYKLPDELEDQVEALVHHLPDDLPHPTGAGIGRLIEGSRLVQHYVDYLVGTASSRFEGLRLVVDCANGSASHLAPEVYRQLGAEVIPLFAEPDGLNINQGCGSTHPEVITRAVLEHGAHAGLAHDGDADRVLLADEKGRLVDGDQVLVICGLDLMAQGKLAHNTVCGTVLSNLGLDLAMSGRGGRVIKAPVGDRYVLEEMRRHGLNLGGEQSGHVIFLDHTTTGDGILTAVQVLSVMARTRHHLSELADQMHRFPQVQVNVRVTDKSRVNENGNITLAVRQAEERLGEVGRVLVRPSGTEPLVRVMLEGPDAAALETLAGELAEVIRRELGSE